MMIHRLLLGGVLALVLLLLPGAAALAASTWYVNGVTGSDTNDCKTPQTACKTIGHAISLASAGDAVQVAAATYPENLTVPVSLGLFGAGAPTTILDGGHLGTVVTIPSAASRVVIFGVTIRNGAAGSATACGGHPGCGGGIFNAGTLTVFSSTFSGNSTPDRNQGGGLGGGIYNAGTLTLIASTLSGNSATHGGGIANDGGTATIVSSTLSGNSADFGGGIIVNGTLTIASSTLSGNSASAGGGIANDTAATLQDTIVADSPQGGNCFGNAVTSRGHSLSSDGTCALSGPGDLNNVDPKLGPLQFNGGPTPTQALLAGSPAIDAGDPSGCKSTNGALLLRDQRGLPRTVDGNGDGTAVCDIGAFERQSWSQVFPATSPSPRAVTAGMVYDQATRSVLVFGGLLLSGGYGNDTWTWDGTTWTQQFPAASPPARNNAALAYDVATGTAVLFGGIDTSNHLLSDTWTWDGQNWTHRFPPASPPPRQSTSMTYDGATRTVVLFGGDGGTGELSDTWTWDGSTWTQAFPTASPAARCCYGVAYDAASRKVILFGGADQSSTYLNDTWSWDGSTWSQESPTRSPSPRTAVSLAFDPAVQGEVLFGGNSQSLRTLDDTWIWTGGDWHRPNFTIHPPNRYYAGMAYDPFAKNLVLFAGWNLSGPIRDDTWLFQ
jgi:hypothetical protein